jgi:predicted DNA-binding ribbon-helix-helix protein
MASHIPTPAGRESSSVMPSAIVKRSVAVGGHKTSVSLEDAFWHSLKEIARSREMNLSDLVGYIDGHRDHGNLSSHIRLFVLEYVRAEVQTMSDARTALNASAMSNSV